VLHHILDPRSGLPAAPVWRTASVAAASCADANAASTAAIIRGEAALAWLDGAGLPARLVAESGGTVSIAAQVETQMGHGWPPVVAALGHGLRPSLSIDVVTTVPGDMFTQIRAAFGSERARANAGFWERDEAATGLLTARRMLEIATVNGAHVAGLESRTGTLTPGKKADVVLIDARAVNVAPVHDPYAAVTLCADVSNVDTVIVDGAAVKRSGKLLADTGHARDLVESSRDYLIGQVEAAKKSA